MPEWLTDSLTSPNDVSPALLVARLVAALVMGAVAAGVFRLTCRASSPTAGSFPATLVLLSVLIAMVTIVIGSSVARAFSLVGALAIVRFRTVVEDTRDTAFVIFAVASGMACGAGYPAAPLAAAPLVFLVSWSFRARVHLVEAGEQALVLRLGTASAAGQKVQAVLNERVPGCRLLGLKTARGGAALDLKYALRPLTPDEALALVAELNRIDGVQGVELKGR